MRPLKRSDLSVEESRKYFAAKEAEMIFSDDFAEQIRKKEEKQRFREIAQRLNKTDLEILSKIYHDKIPTVKLPALLSEGHTFSTRQASK